MENTSVKIVLLGLFVVLFAVNALAIFSSGVPESIVFNELPRDLSFNVSNTDSVARDLKVEVFLPVQYEFVQKPSRVLPGETKTVSLRLFPRPDMVGQEFVGTLKASLGDSIAEKSIRLKFLGQTMCPVSINSHVREVQSSLGQSFEIVSKLENHKQEQVAVFFKNALGVPVGWGIVPSELSKIGPFEKAVHVVSLQPSSSFDGEVKLLFYCDGFIESRTVHISHEQKDFLSGFLTLFSLDFFNSELLLNAFLVFVAAVLLIAFISRLVRKLSAPSSGRPVPVNGAFVAQSNQDFSESGFSAARHSVGNSSLNLEELKRKISGK